MNQSLKLCMFSCFLFVSLIRAQGRYGQTDNFNNLVKSIQILPLLDKDKIDHNIPELRNTIETKVNYAQTYLTIELTKLVLADSSDYYEKKLKELRQLEAKKLKGKDSITWLNEKEKLYLLTSVLNPSRSDTCLFKLIKIWYDVNVPIRFYEYEECVINYKIWLYELGENRFIKEKEAKYFTKHKEACYFKKALLDYDLPYKNITQEKLKLEKDKKLLQLSGRDSLRYNFYTTRATKLSEANLKNHTDSLTNYIEQLWLEAYSLKPENYSLNKNIFIFYYNEGATLMRSIEYEMTEKEVGVIQEKVKKLFKKAMLHAEKIGLADQYKDKLDVK